MDSSGAVGKMFGYQSQDPGSTLTGADFLLQLLFVTKTNISRILTELLSKYDRNLVPKMKGVDVDVELLIQRVSEISEIQSSSTMHILFSQIWHDPGLSFEVGACARLRLFTLFEAPFVLKINKFSA